jgi:hypothetical protein
MAQFLLQGRPFVPLRFDPPRLPVQAIEMVDG